MEVFIGTIQAFAFNYAPRGWITCQGQILGISQYSAVFSLLGTNYGGNGQTTFGIPDLQGRAAVGQGNGVGVSPHVIGQIEGTESVTLTQNNLPAHTHSLMGSTVAAASNTPNNTEVLAMAQGTDETTLNAVTVNIYGPPTTLTPLSPQAIGPTGNNIPVSIINPQLTINYSMCLDGLFPSRN